MNINFKAKIFTKPSEVGFVSFCPDLDVWSQGDTEAEAKEMIQEAVQLFLESCWEMGTLHKVLKGIKISFEILKGEDE